MSEEQERRDEQLPVLTPRERALVKAAAKQAIAELSDEFFRDVGKTLVTRVLIFVGVAVCSYMVGKGWISPPK